MSQEQGTKCSKHEPIGDTSYSDHYNRFFFNSFFLCDIFLYHAIYPEANPGVVKMLSL